MPATYNAAMRGVRRAEQDRSELALFVAWQTAAFSRAEKLKPFRQYLKRMQNPRSDPRDLLAGFKAMAANGLAVKIETKRKSED